MFDRLYGVKVVPFSDVVHLLSGLLRAVGDAFYLLVDARQLLEFFSVFAELPSPVCFAWSHFILGAMPLLRHGRRSLALTLARSLSVASLCSLKNLQSHMVWSRLPAGSPQ